VALKTPFTLNSMLTTFPKKLYFTFKFFTFQTASTETVFLKDPASPSVLADAQPKMGSQYLLEKVDKTSYSATVLDGVNVIRIFDIDPSLKEGLEDDDVDDHMQLAKYLKERVMTIDLWNGDSLMHFGTCKIPLYAFMR
jgi:hypothetical protein